MQEGRPRQRRRHDAALKERVLAECDAPGAAVAQVALAHGLNANLVHKWRRLAAVDVASIARPAMPAQFVRVALPPASEPPSNIRVDLRRGQTSITVT